jgi:hypothetical protein
LGITQLPAIIRDELASPEARVRAALQANAFRRQGLKLAERKALAERLLLGWPMMSDVALAEASGVSRPTVITIRRVLEDEGRIPRGGYRELIDGRVRTVKPRPEPEPDIDEPQPKRPVTAARERQRQHDDLEHALNLLETITPRVALGAYKGLDRDRLFDRAKTAAQVLLAITDDA